MRGGVRRGEDVELRQRRCLVLERDFLAVAEIASCSGEWGHFEGLREQTDVVWNNARSSHARPVRFDTSGVALVAGEGKGAEILRWVLRIVRVVGSANRGLVRNDEDIPEAGELLCNRSDIVVADQNVLVFFFYQLIPGRYNDFNDVLARGQHGGAVSRVGHANRAVGACH